MKLANLKTVSGMHLAAMTDRGVVDLTAAGCVLSLQDLVCGADCSSLGAYRAQLSGTCAGCRL